MAKPEDEFDYVWIVDSDVIVLRADAFVHAADFLEEQHAAAVGEFQFDMLREGYAHISSLLIKGEKVWRRSIDPFDNSGPPARALQVSLRRHSQKICNFPFHSKHYVLHLSQGTLNAIIKNDVRNSRVYDWAMQECVKSPKYGFHGDTNGPLIYKNFLTYFHAEVPSLSPEEVVKACLKSDLLDFNFSSFKKQKMAGLGQTG